MCTNIHFFDFLFYARYTAHVSPIFFQLKKLLQTNVFYLLKYETAALQALFRRQAKPRRFIFMQ
ncbi:hypothetical protein DWV29_22660 [Enterocloster asparagiformis]|uniref:Uncharacterized protein n=2 Tax=Enterocloster asparagiformis TaxID=333367 RepID=C0DBI4_9FIRM|nr:hypothetical protein CLOSTASPAR_06639 [[Clostridium] asparagiforme DSM 15981]RGX24571.1 hypothetical protein DWV29_22660 [Enterocloster asparagiformis]